MPMMLSFQGLFLERERNKGKLFVDQWNKGNESSRKLQKGAYFYAYLVLYTGITSFRQLKQIWL